MAFQTRQRDPLFDAATQAVLERRAQELLGLALLGVGTVLALALASYTPSDPSFLGTSSEAPQNWLGHFGAYLAAPLHVVLGVGAWGLALSCLVWGVRLLLHLGAERALGRSIFLPILVALASVYAATHPPGQGWSHSFGLGGLFGDTALGVILGVLPVAPAFGLKLSAAALAMAMLALGLFSLGFTRVELRGAGRFLWFGLLFGFDRLVNGMGRSAGRARDGIASRAETRRDRRAARLRAEEAQNDDDLIDDDLIDNDMAYDAPEPAGRTASALGFFSRMARRAQPDSTDADDDALLDGDDRVRGKINDAIRSRLRSDRMMAAAARQRVEPVVSQPQKAAPVAPVVPVHDPIDDEEEAYAPAVRMAATPRLAARLLDGRAQVDDTGVVHDDPDDLDDPDDVAPAAMGAGAIPRYEPPRPRVEHSVHRTTPSRQAAAEAQPGLRFDDEEDDPFVPPPLSLLRDPSGVEKTYLSDEALEENARMLENVLDDYGVKGDIVSVRPGPVVTMYELEPAPGLKASRVIGLADDIARSMSALSARVSTVPGRSVIGIELPNEHREMVLLREILSARDFGDSKLRLPLALGKDIGGESIVANLAKMPHLLIAGTTGSGKSVAINTMILSLLYKLTPEECRLIMIDPKMLELSVYDGIPHLLSPVVTDPKKAVVALKWVVAEMEDRYRKMSKMGVRNIEGYNGKVRVTLDKGEMFRRTVQTGFDDETGEPVFETEEFKPETLPYIVVIVDEMADLMMVAGKEIEACIQRLAQMARASGIHLIMATQRPSVDVITGTIKANFPTRISFQVTSKIDSRTILGEQGAEQLLGMGDMLYMAGGSRITRVHGPFVSDEEVEEVVNFLKSYGPPTYVGSVAEGPDDDKAEDIDIVLGLGGNTGGEDALYDQAVQIVLTDRKCSTSYIQRKLAIGYNKAARLVEQMEENGLVSPANHVGKREILVPEAQ
jgi:S-DNA-T family DNA segregation ATPase FtsK/SpoIIIE